MSPPPAATLAAAIEIKVGGQALDPSIMERLLEARVQDNLMLPDAFLLRLRDPDFTLVDGDLFSVDAQVELKFTASAEAAPGDAFKGEVSTIAPQFEGEGCVLVVRGYDFSHRLHRTRKTRTFQDMTASDIASKIIGEAGLSADAQHTSDVYPFEQQSNESDWDYLWRLAARVGYELVCAEGKVHFRRPGSDAGAPVALEWGEELRAFHPRATNAAQPASVQVSGWNPQTKARVAANAGHARLDSSIGLQRTDFARDGGTIEVTDQIVTNQGEAQGLAQSTLDRLANGWLEADGTSKGNPKIRAGSKVSITGVGTRFGGDYLVTRSTHVIRGEKGYQTEFEISGRSRRTLIDLLTPTPRHDYTASLVIGVVTNNDDPEKMCRVRVKFPGLDDEKEGWWARVASLSASGTRGMMMMPLVGDEVVVGFEHGDPRRPFVLGSVWNGTNKPEKLAAEGGSPDGSFNLRSDEKISIQCGADMSIGTEAKMEAKSQSDLKLEAGADIAVEAKGSQIAIKAGGATVTLKSGGQIEVKGTTIELKGTAVTVEGSANLTLKSSGVVKISGAQVMLG